MGYRRSQEEKRRLKCLYHETSRKVSTIRYNTEKQRIERHYSFNYYSKKYGKKVSEKKIRTMSDTLNNGLYRKVKNYVQCG